MKSIHIHGKAFDEKDFENLIIGGQNQADTIRLVVPRLYANELDLLSWQWIISYENEDGKGDSILLEAKESETSADNLWIDWKPTNSATQKKGRLVCQLYATKDNQRFTTKPFYIYVSEMLNPDPIQASSPSYIEQTLEIMRQYTAELEVTRNTVEESAYNASISESNARISESRSKESERNAASSASAALSSENNAKESEANAKNSENASAQSASNALSSENNVILKEEQISEILTQIQNLKKQIDDIKSAVELSETNAAESSSSAAESANAAKDLLDQADLNLIESIEQTKTSTESGGENQITITQKNGNQSIFSIFNPAVPLVQTTGTSTTSAMSQKAVTEALKTKASESHSHVKEDITDFDHNHDDRYYTEDEVNTKVNELKNTIVAKENMLSYEEIMASTPPIDLDVGIPKASVLKSLKESLSDFSALVSNYGIYGVRNIDDLYSYPRGEGILHFSSFSNTFSTGTLPFSDGHLLSLVWRNTDAGGGIITQLAIEDNDTIIKIRSYNISSWSSWKSVSIS